jgi:hypothetical protein
MGMSGLLFGVFNLTMEPASRPSRFNHHGGALSGNGHGRPIEHVIVDDLPVGPNHWVREHFQRRAISRGLGAPRPGPEGSVWLGTALMNRQTFRDAQRGDDSFLDTSGEQPR